ncbi:alpha/beta fold hydrolase [Kerstersia gyiorum]|uniref:alpha/beta fold hydrolase n=1 Tax=Kerstersia gyiorum TaxID=206506 RepID=UPI00209F62C9|nr:alpha/beta hydrolase [Kerstersia gyiorum]MCP1636050.1 2-hydroxymuconate-semialdehyde hydrolase [Kerstersia gyiorum]MCP1672258.1 2-hydroxymuconate-semialdehyde hydrolase [Kerstersia gyiorum]MCP1710256.1 2-hydroxymuconate-semialdehyde hydrolase [Kerstersia gyiorum]
MSASSSDTNPEIGRSVMASGLRTNVHDMGSGAPVLLIHGSGPGVSAWANWRTVMPTLAQRARVIAPDMAGFGYSEGLDLSLPGVRHDLFSWVWVRQALGVLDALGIEQADIVGNSFGGALALALAIRHPERVRRLVLMGSVGVPFALTPGLDSVWGYTPSPQSMRQVLDIFAHDRNLVSDELAQLRYQASIRPGVQEASGAMFPAPRQRWVDALASHEEDIRTLPHETLIIHGREDQVIPLQNSLTLSQWIPRSQLHVFGHCGHWTQIEHAARFSRLVGDFLAEAGQAEPKALADRQTATRQDTKEAA